MLIIHRFVLKLCCRKYHCPQLLNPQSIKKNSPVLDWSTLLKNSKISYIRVDTNLRDKYGQSKSSPVYLYQDARQFKQFIDILLSSKVFKVPQNVSLYSYILFCLGDEPVTEIECNIDHKRKVIYGDGWFSHDLYDFYQKIRKEQYGVIR
jgi:hypothetical protein